MDKKSARKKRKHNKSNGGTLEAKDNSKVDAIGDAHNKNKVSNPFYEKAVIGFLDNDAVVTLEERQHFFSNEHVSPDRRAELWMQQADLGESLTNEYSWAVPNEQALKILKHFSPIIEVGCGANAYWAKLMKQSGVDILAFDIDTNKGGKISNNNVENNKGDTKSKKRKKKNKNYESFVKHGGPEVLSNPKYKDRTLFLCYPDDYESVTNKSNVKNSNDDDDDDDSNDDDDACRSMAMKCLKNFTGTYVVHVGELNSITRPTLAMDQAPWGRSSDPGFQQELAANFHCLLQLPLPSWLHVRDALTVWKRSEKCTILYENDNDEVESNGGSANSNNDNDDDDDDKGEEVEFRYIPPDEQLPQLLVAPCLQHLIDSQVDTHDKQCDNDFVNNDSNGDKDNSGNTNNNGNNKESDLNDTKDEPTNDKKDRNPNTEKSETENVVATNTDGSAVKKKRRKKKRKTQVLQ